MADMIVDTPRPVRAALVGVAAGLVAAFAMSRFQAMTSGLAGQGGGDDDPATVKAANAVSQAATGARLPADQKEAAGEAVHYVTGAALGLLYGLAAEYRPEVAKGFGTGFGSVTAVLLDEAAVPALGLSAGPIETPPATHAYSVASHWVFGASLEAARRVLMRV